MKVAALTMVHRDHWFLGRWVSHYGKAFSEENLYIVSHGDETPIRRITSNCNVIGIAKETAGDFDVLRWNLLNDILSILLKNYDCVIVGDVDEYIVPNPKYGTDLVEQLKSRSEYPVSFVTGMEIFETHEDKPIDDTMPVLSQRRVGTWNWRYTKASIVYEPVRVGRGAHFVVDSPYYNAENLLMFHLKFSNLAVFDEVLESRAEIRELGSDGKTRTPRGNGWTKGTLDNNLRKMNKQPFIPFYEGLAKFREGTYQDPEISKGRVFPKRYFINSWFNLPAEFIEIL